MQTVYKAEQPRCGAMGSFGDASYMLIRQHQFPHEYDPDLDKITGRDHDRIMQQDYEHGNRCFEEHTNTGDGGLQWWAEEATPEQIFAFLKDILKADEDVEWTGFRILGTVNRGNGYPVYTLQLFAKHPDSQTKVFDTENAPHLIRGSRHKINSFFDDK